VPAGIGCTLSVTLVIVALLGVLVVCYRQVIAAYPDGGGDPASVIAERVTLSGFDHRKRRARRDHGQ
jgi:hypothetical protein